MHYLLYFALTCFSIIWQILIIAVLSPGIIEFWEVLVTLLSVPIPQIVASYIVDRLQHKRDNTNGLVNHDDSTMVRLAPEEEQEN